MARFPKKLKFSCYSFVWHLKSVAVSLNIFLMFFCLSSNSSAQYFTPSWQGGAYNPMTIIISGATLDSLDLEAGDEIGLFDNWQCVGAAVLQESIDPENDDTYLYITCSEDDPDSPQQDGFTVGNPIEVRYYDLSVQEEGWNLSLAYPFSPQFADSTYQAMQTSILSVEAYSEMKLSFPSANVCVHDLLQLPLLVSEIAIADSFSINLRYDTSMLEFLGINELHPEIQAEDLNYFNYGAGLYISKGRNGQGFQIIEQDSLMLLDFTAKQEGYPALYINEQTFFVGLFGNVLPKQIDYDTVLIDPLPLIYDVHTTDEACYSSADGSIYIDCAPMDSLMYSINGGEDWQSSPEFDGLAPGSYTVQVQNGNQCRTLWLQNPVYVHAADSFYFEYAEIRDADCYHNPNGYIRMQVAGGDGGYQYSIDDGQTWQQEAVFQDLAPGTYKLHTRDSRDCIVSFPGNPAQIDSPPEILINNVQWQEPQNCSSNTGSISVDAVGGSGTLLYSINAGADWQQSSEFGSLSCGTYHLQVKDADEDCMRTYENNPVVLDGLTSLPDVDAARNFIAYPNPFQDQIKIKQIDSYNGKTLLQLFDPCGQLLMEQAYHGDQGEILLQLSFLKAGLYELRIFSPDHQQTIIIQKTQL